MPRLEEIKNELKEAVRNNLDTGMTRLLNYIQNNDLCNQIRVQQARLAEYRNKYYGGLISMNDSNPIPEQITYMLLHLIDGLDESDLRIQHSSFSAAIHRLGIIEKNMGVLKLVDGDRDEQIDYFWRIFDAKKVIFEDPNASDAQKLAVATQFYFFPSCPDQCADGFSERLVHEIKDEFKHHKNDYVDFEKYEEERLERAQKPRLPMESKLSSSKDSFRDYFITRFTVDNQTVNKWLNENQALADSDWLSRCGSVVIFIFKISKIKSHTLQYLKWLVEIFKRRTDPKYIVLFFIIISKQGYHEQPDSEIQEILMNLKQSAMDTVTIIEPFLPVRIMEDLTTWLHDMNLRNSGAVADVVNLYKMRYSIYQRDNSDVTNMIDMQDFQKILYMISQTL